MGARTMATERRLRIKRLFQAALKRNPSERNAFLDGACMDDPSLREEVQSLIASHDEPTDLLEKGAIDGMGRPNLDEEAGGKRDAAGPAEPTTARAASLEGQRLGPYRVLQEIGHGGMGAVYRAVRDDDQFKKRVAIKVLLKGMDTDDIVRRFRNERQILAGIDHAHIAKLYDGGTTEGGRPYFVMELIEGNPIDAYSDTHRLSITERLKLFRKVCSAVHFAHQNLVVHRTSSRATSW